MMLDLNESVWLYRDEIDTFFELRVDLFYSPRLNLSYIPRNSSLCHKIPINFQSSLLRKAIRLVISASFSLFYY